MPYMQGRTVSLSKKIVCRWLRELSGGRAQASCGENNSLHKSPIVPSSASDCGTWMVPRSMDTLVKIHTLHREGTRHNKFEVQTLDLLGIPSIQVQALTRAAFPPLNFTTGPAKMCCANTSNSLTAFVIPAVRHIRTVTDMPNVLGWGAYQIKVSTKITGISSFGDSGMRHHDGAKVEAVPRTRAVPGCCNSRRSPSILNSRCSSYSSGSLFGNPIHNDCHCSTPFDIVNARTSLKSKEGAFGNAGRLRATAGDTEFAENLEVAPVDVIRPKALAEDGSLSARFNNPVVTRSSLETRLIHATAVVHPGALLGKGVEIGAFCTVGPQVKLGNGCKLQPSCHIFGNTQLGENCVLFSGAVVGADIPGHTIIGNNNTIGHYAVVGAKCQDMKYKEGDECFLYIGNNNDIREFTSIHRSSKPNDNTVVGNDNLIMGSCHVAHDCKIGNHNILANGTLLGGHIVIEDLVHTGGAVAVHQFCNLGSYSFLAGGSVVDRDVPMFMMVAGDRAELRGLNLEGMRRCGFSDLEVRSIRKAYQKLFMNSDPNAGGMEERLSELDLNEELSTVPAVKSMLQSVRDCFGEKRRGICRFRHWTTV